MTTATTPNIMSAQDAVLAWERFRIDHDATEWSEENEPAMLQQGRRVWALRDIAAATPCCCLADAHALLRLVAHEIEEHGDGREQLPTIRAIQSWMVQELDAASETERKNTGV